MLPVFLSSVGIKALINTLASRKYDFRSDGTTIIHHWF